VLSGETISCRWDRTNDYYSTKNDWIITDKIVDSDWVSLPDDCIYFVNNAAEDDKYEPADNI